ncbi:AMP nucleosidase (plasmid) [Escherichia coli]|nr:AMP nucleosidase [Escherichia coli]
MLPSETMIWQPEFTDKTLSRKPGAVQSITVGGYSGLPT